MNKVIRLRDYSPVPSEYVPLCKALQESIRKRESTLVDLWGQPQKDITLFASYSGGYWVQEYTGAFSYRYRDTQYQILIGSRFDREDASYFLCYAFQRAFGDQGRFFRELPVQSDPEKTWDLLLVLRFFQELRTALKSGVYREYVRYRCNDSRVNGPIDVPRHLRENLLFRGSISYDRRENTADNDINRLLLTALSWVQKRYPTLYRSHVQGELKRQLVQLPALVRNGEGLDARGALARTDRVITRHIFRDYEALRKTARLLLRRMGVNIMEDARTPVYGVAVNMAKLWERFLENSALGSLGYRAQSKLPILDGGLTMKPDFLLQQEGRTVVLDAKYKAKWSKRFVREDVYQVLAYQLAFSAPVGGCIFPTTDALEPDCRPVLAASGGELWFWRLPLRIPAYGAGTSYEEFQRELDREVEGFRHMVQGM